MVPSVGHGAGSINQLIARGGTWCVRQNRGPSAIRSSVLYSLIRPHRLNPLYRRHLIKGGSVTRFRRAGSFKDLTRKGCQICTLPVLAREIPGS